jgi:hypothetical protein
MKLSTPFRSLTISLVIFALALATLLLLAPFLPYPWVYLTRLLAVFPAIWVGYEATRVVRGLDELQQRITLETLAFSLANTALVIFALGLLQISGKDNPNLMWILLVFAVFSGIGLWMVRRRYQ